MMVFSAKRILLGAGVPIGVYYVFSKADMAFAGAVSASLWCLCLLLWFYYKERQLDGFAGVSAVYAVSELAGLLVSHDPKWFFLSPIVSDGIMGMVFVVSMLAVRPLIQVLGEQMSGEHAPPKDAPGYRRYRGLWLRLSVVWGGAYLLKGGLALLLLKTCSEEVYLVARAVLSTPTILALIMFSFWYPRRYFGMPDECDN